LYYNRTEEKRGKRILNLYNPLKGPENLI